MINHNHTNINPVTVVLGDQTKLPVQIKQKYPFGYSSITQRCLLLFILLTIILTGLIIVGSIWSIHLRMEYNNILNEQKKNNEKILYLNNLLSKYNKSI